MPNLTKRLQPTQIIALSFLSLITVGTVLLLLPVSTVKGISPVNALFTATSATCVTGLIVMDTGRDFTLFGQLVILCLFQLGGLGIMTFSTFFILLLRKRAAPHQRMVVGETFSPGPLENFSALLKTVVLVTLGIELTGAALLFTVFHQNMPTTKAIYFSIFHSISSFCNAGFSLLSNSFSDFKGSSLINTVVPLLIIAGGIGFIIILELYYYLSRFRQKRPFKFSLHTKITIFVTMVLIPLGAISFWLLERNYSLKALPPAQQFFVSFFQSITPRTAGFNTIDFAMLSNPTLFFTIILMFIGASPGSTGGGVKTTTIGILIANFLSKLRGSERVNIFRRTLNEALINRASIIILLAIILITLIAFGVLIAEQGNHSSDNTSSNPLGTLFEVVSAFGTVGLSTGITPELTITSKLLITAMMFMGRLGPLTLALALAKRERRALYSYPEESVMIG